MSNGLTDPQIERLILRYRFELARYEQAALHTAAELRQALRSAAISRYLLAFRAKHPDGLREKLERKRSAYAYEELEIDLNSRIKDLSGCRLLAYSSEDAERIVEVVEKHHWRAKLDFPSKSFGEPSRYKAVHILLVTPDTMPQSVADALCEVQVTTLAAHLFNELEHDLIYKEPDGAGASDAEHEHLNQLFGVLQQADRIASKLHSERKRAMAHSELLESAEQLQAALEGSIGRQLDGDLEALYAILSSVLRDLTLPVLEAFGRADDVLAKGRQALEKLGLPDQENAFAYLWGLRANEQFRPLLSIIEEQSGDAFGAMGELLRKARNASAHNEQ